MSLGTIYHVAAYDVTADSVDATDCTMVFRRAVLRFRVRTEEGYKAVVR